MRNVAGSDRVPSNVSVCIHRQLHRVRWILVWLNVRWIEIGVDGELLKVGIVRLEAKLTGNCDGAGERAEPIDCLLLNSLRSVDDSGCNACFARSEKS